MPAPPSRIAVWNTAFLGDAVLTLPLLATVSVAFPEAQVDFYLRPGLGSLFVSQPNMRITEVPQKDFISFLSRTVRPRKHDLWLGAHSSPRAAFAALASGAGLRVGYSGVGRFFGYNRLVPRRFNELDEIERLLQLLRPVQKLFPGTLPGDFDPDDAHSPSHWPMLVLPLGAEAEARAFWNEHKLHLRPTLGIHPGSVWPTKRWGGFAAVAREAVDAGCAVLVFGGPDEEATASALLAEAGLVEGDGGLVDGVFNLSGKLSLPVLAAYLKRLTAYTGNDSGPMHLAWTQGTPVSAVFGPTVRQLGFFPRAATVHDAVVLEIDLPCRPCGLHGPKVCPLGHHQCMTDIAPERVWKVLHTQIFRCLS